MDEGGGGLQILWAVECEKSNKVISYYTYFFVWIFAGEIKLDMGNLD